MSKNESNSIANQSPLIRVNPVSTMEAAREHLKGIGEIVLKTTDSRYSLLMVMLIVNNLAMVEQTLDYLQKVLERYVKGSEVEKVREDGE